MSPVDLDLRFIFTALLISAVVNPLEASRYHSRKNQQSQPPSPLPTVNVTNATDGGDFQPDHSSTIDQGRSSKNSLKHVAGLGHTYNIQDYVIIPRFPEPVNNVTVVAGRDAVLRCAVDNLHKFKVAWVRVDTHSILTIHNKVITRNYRISLAQADGRNWVLRISNVQESDRGWYMCQVNTDPMRYQKAYVEVVVPPDIIDGESSTDTIVREGSNASLVCRSRGHPPPHILWRREDGGHFGHGKQKVTSLDGDVLELPRVSRLHMGAYLCIASNGIPPSLSKRIMLSVQFPPVLWIPNQLEGNIVGQEANLSCQIEAFPVPIVYWTTESGGIVAADNRRVMTTALEKEYKMSMMLTIKNISREDFGGYRCIVRNSLGETDGVIRLYEVPAVTRLPVETTRLDNEVDEAAHQKNTALRKTESSRMKDEVERPRVHPTESSPVQRTKQHTSRSQSWTIKISTVPLLIFSVPLYWLGPIVAASSHWT